MSEVRTPITAAEVVGHTAARLGVAAAFGVVGSGNYVVTEALLESAVPFYGTRHESAAASAADAFWRTSGRLAVCSVHQGPGLANAVSALGEAAKSRVPLLVLAGASTASALRSNFAADQAGLLRAVGCGVDQIYEPRSAAVDTARAVRRALDEQRPILLNLPLDVQAGAVDRSGHPPILRPSTRVCPEYQVLRDLADRLQAARSPVIIAGQGAWRSGAADALARVAEATGARLATTALGLGMFAGNPRSVGVAGGFSTEATAAVLDEADLILAVGASLTTWTTRGDTIFRDTDTVVQVDSDPAALGLNSRVDFGVVGDARATALALLELLPDEPRPLPTAPPEDVGSMAPFAEDGPLAHPRRLTERLAQMLPRERTLVVDGGHFIGWPMTGLQVPDPSGLVFSSAGFQSIGLGMGAAVGAAVARPDRLPVLAVGDGGFLMGVSELETMVRLKLPVLVAVYNDAAYGAEVHHFADRPAGRALVSFPETDVAALASGIGARSATVRSVDDLVAIEPWLPGRDRPLVLDLKIDPTVVGSWAEQDFHGH